MLLNSLILVLHSRGQCGCHRGSNSIKLLLLLLLSLPTTSPYARILPLEVFDPCPWADWGARQGEIYISVHPTGRSDGKQVQLWSSFSACYPWIAAPCNPKTQNAPPGFGNLWGFPLSWCLDLATFIHFSVLRIYEQQPNNFTQSDWIKGKKFQSWLK